MSSTPENPDPIDPDPGGDPAESEEPDNTHVEPGVTGQRGAPVEPEVQQEAPH